MEVEDDLFFGSRHPDIVWDNNDVFDLSSYEFDTPPEWTPELPPSALDDLMTEEATPPSSPTKKRPRSTESEEPREDPKRIRWDWLQLVSPPTALGAREWVGQLSADLWAQIVSAMKSSNRMFPDARVIAEASRSRPDILQQMEYFGGMWKYLFELDMLGIAAYMGGVPSTFLDMAVAGNAYRTFCLRPYVLIYGKSRERETQEALLTTKANEWRTWKLLLEMRRRIRLNWTKSWPIANLADAPAPTFRPISNIGQRVNKSKPVRQFIDGNLCFINIDSFPWPVVISGDKIGFAISSSAYVYHTLRYPIYGTRHRSANMAVVPYSDGSAVLLAVCSNMGVPILAVQTFHALELIELAIGHAPTLFSTAVAGEPQAVSLGYGSSGAAILFHLDADSWPEEWAALRLGPQGAGRRTALGRSIFPSSLTATERMVCLAFSDGLFFFRWSLSSSFFIGLETEIAFPLETTRFVTWDTLAPILGDAAAHYVLAPVVGVTDIRVVEAEEARSRQGGYGHLFDNSFDNPTRLAVGSGEVSLPWVDIVQVKMTSTAAGVYSATLALWRQAEALGETLLQRARTKESRRPIRWDNIQITGAAVGLVVRFYEPEATNPDQLLSVAPDLKAKVIMPAKPHRLVNPDIPWMQSNAAGVATVISGLTDNTRLIVELIPWHGVRDNSLMEHEAALRVDLSIPMARDDEISPYASWSFETDALTVVQQIAKRQSDDVPHYYALHVRTILLGEYANGAVIANAEFARIERLTLQRKPSFPLVDDLAFRGTYMKGQLIMLARQTDVDSGEVGRNFLQYIDISWLGGPPASAMREADEKRKTQPFVLSSKQQ